MGFICFVPRTGPRAGEGARARPPARISTMANHAWNQGQGRRRVSDESWCVPDTADLAFLRWVIAEAKLDCLIQQANRLHCLNADVWNLSIAVEEASSVQGGR